MDADHILDGVRLLQFISVVKGKICEPNAPDVGYLTSYNGCFTVREYVKNCNGLFELFKFHLLNLPIIQPDAKSRYDFLKTVHSHSNHLLLQIEEYRRFGLPTKFPYRSNLPELTIADIFPRAFNENFHPTIQDYHNHKLHYIAMYQEQVVKEALNLLDFIGENHGLIWREGEINGHHLNGTPIRFETQLSVSALAFFSLLVAEAMLGKDVNRSDLARYLSEHFKTNRSAHPSHQQIYKAFYELDEHTQEVVKGLIIKMLNKINSMQR